MLDLRITALNLFQKYEPFFQALPLENGRPDAAVAGLGGTGRAHGYKVSREFVKRTAKSVFHAGGLTPSNASEDISSAALIRLDPCSALRLNNALDKELLD
jgi:phosphoribosylanthranilate isomerase